VKDSCEKIQHYGAKKDDTGTKDEPSDKVSLDRIKLTLVDVKKEYAEAEKLLKRYYEGQPQ
jgi:osomolarity two-component system, phosphorelay intermediate protein YPD1